MATFLDLFGFIAVLLRGATLALGSISIGGVVFARLVSRLALKETGRRLLAISSFTLAITEALGLSANAAMLRSTTGLSFSELVGANAFVWGLVSVGAALIVGFLAVQGRETSWLSVVGAALLLTAEVATSHAAARLTGQLPLLLLTAVHQGATAAWIGGLPYLFLKLRQNDTRENLLRAARGFSRLALWSVALLFAAGVGLSYYYVGSPAALYGTNYGLMVSGKALLFLLVLALGAVNFRIIGTLQRNDFSWAARIARISEAEIGIGFTVVLAAASLTSQPPGVDLTADRVTIPVIVARITPQAPRLQTPPLSSLSPSQRETWKKEHPVPTANASYIPGQSFQPSSPGDIAWSEYNHHWAGVIVLMVGVLAVLSRFRRFRWARHWPLAFIGLAVFLLLRSDAEAWPLGPDGFWESFLSADVAQHRLFVVLVIAFAVFEWGVVNGRLRSQAATLVFPGVCALGGALLLTHTHAISNLQEQLLIELSHLPLALLAVVAGWARWLELRYPGSRRQWAAHVWPICFTMIGIVLLLYREA